MEPPERRPAPAPPELAPVAGLRGRQLSWRERVQAQWQLSLAAEAEVPA